MLFSFNETEKGTRVRAADLYDENKGYGFITDKNPPEPGLGNHFILPSYYGSEDVVVPETGKDGIFVDSYETGQKLEAEKGRLIPLCFAADVPEYGNYKIRVRLTGNNEIIIFAGSRRLILRRIFQETTRINVVFDLNVSRIIPRGSTTPADRKKVFVTILGMNVALSQIEIQKADTPTIFICGDSTVTDQPADYPYAPGTSYSGWGQMLQDHIFGMAVSNHAHSGLTTESFRSEGHYAIVREMIRPGDYIMFQFAHNDQKLPHLKAKEGYRERLIQYIEEARAAGAFPLMVTPLARNTWKPDNGGYNDLLWEYAEECIALGGEYKVPVIDLHDYSMREILRHGLESSKRFYFPKDYTHTNDYGAYKMSAFIAEELTKLKGDYAPLADASMSDPLRWKTSVIPVVPEIPLKYRNVGNAAEEQAAGQPERPDEYAKRAEALDMVVKAAKFFPTNVFNDLYDDIVGHEWYAGTVQCAYQNGLIPKDMIEDRKFRAEDDIRLEDLICFMMSAYESRRKAPDAESCGYDGKCRPYALKYVRIAVKLGLLKENRDLNDKVRRREVADMCRALGL